MHPHWIHIRKIIFQCWNADKLGIKVFETLKTPIKEFFNVSLKRGGTD
jgi:hypothetical protein